jgi:hypothetical protein
MIKTTLLLVTAKAIDNSVPSPSRGRDRVRGKYIRDR